MILADKIIKERKKLGLSQEELAEKMNVSRQAVSKWEGAQCIPDIEKILQLSELFGVTTDYLLKDDIENEDKSIGTSKDDTKEENKSQAVTTVTVEKSGGFLSNRKAVSIGTSEDDTKEENKSKAVKTVTMEQAEDFLSKREAAAKSIAIGTFLCILSVVPLFLLRAAGESHRIGLSESTAGGLGIVLMLIIVSAAVGLLVYPGFKNAPYEFLEKEPFEAEQGVADMVRERQRAFSSTYTKFNIIGTIICILSPIPILIGACINNEFFMLAMLAATIVIAGIGAIFFIMAGVRNSAMQMLLQEGKFSVEEKSKSSIKGKVFIIYWILVSVVYLFWHFLARKQNSYSWLTWAVGGMLFPVVMILCGIFEKNGKEK